jgi:hypothetical protein
VSRLTTAKLGLLILGLALTAFGIRAEVDALRWAGIGLFAVAFFLRFFPRARD